MKVAVIGAGPIGLETAAAARAAGHEVVVFEAGDSPASAMQQWAHVRLFTPWADNTTPLGRSQTGLDLALETFPTAGEYIERYLHPLAATLPIELETRVVGVARQNSCKEQAVLAEARTRDPFRLLLHGPTGDAASQADAVFDCTGTWSQPKPVGRGGLPALGELASVASGRLRHGPQPVEGLRDRRVLLVGDGPSATIMLRDLLERPSPPEIVWISRQARGPSFDGGVDSAHPALAALFDFASRAVCKVDHRPGAQIDALRPVAREIEVHLGSGEVLLVDRVFGCTGFLPDVSLYRELHVPSCPRTEAPDPDRGGPMTGESGFFVLGSKRAGRRDDFLLQHGHRQIARALECL